MVMEPEMRDLRYFVFIDYPDTDCELMYFFTLAESLQYADEMETKGYSVTVEIIY